VMLTGIDLVALQALHAPPALVSQRHLARLDNDLL
jgi:hypothetical protein